MGRELGAVALLFFLSLNADATSDADSGSQDPPVCGVCMELDNETLPDKHYFPGKDFAGYDDAVLADASHKTRALTLSEQIWTSGSPHSGGVAGNKGPVNGNNPRNRIVRHREPLPDADHFEEGQWAYGGLRECNRGPEGKIAAGCHRAHYDNLLCNSHYDECDDEFFAVAVAAVERGDARALNSLLHRPGTTVVLNKKREAIQLVGCSGDIVGNLPISKSLLQALQ